MTMRNDSDEDRTVIAALSARSIYYTGINSSIIKKVEGKVKLAPKQTQVSSILARNIIYIRERIWKYKFMYMFAMLFFQFLT